MLLLQKQFLGLEDPTEENEWMKYIYLQSLTTIQDFEWAYTKVLTLVA